jgi:hypothetical protein
LQEKWLNDFLEAQREIEEGILLKRSGDEKDQFIGAVALKPPGYTLVLVGTVQDSRGLTYDIILDTGIESIPLFSLSPSFVDFTKYFKGSTDLLLFGTTCTNSTGSACWENQNVCNFVVVVRFFKEQNTFYFCAT